MTGGWSAVSSMSSWTPSSASGTCPARGASASASAIDQAPLFPLLPSTVLITTTDYGANGSTRPPARRLSIRTDRSRTGQGMNPAHGRRRRNQQRASSPTPRRPPRTQGTRERSTPSPSRTCPALEAGFVFVGDGAPPYSASLRYEVPAADGRTRTASTEVKGIAYDVAHGLGGDGSRTTT